MSVEKDELAVEKSCCFCVECSNYFWKDLDARSATKTLQKLPEGSFLLRPSQHPLYEYTLSQKGPKKHVVHIRIGRDDSGRYLMDTDVLTSNLSLIPFCCIINLIKSWSRVYRDVGKNTCELTPVSITSENPVYINEDDSNACFYDDETADKAFYNFFNNFFTKSKTFKPE